MKIRLLIIFIGIGIQLMAPMLGSLSFCKFYNPANSASDDCHPDVIVALIIAAIRTSPEDRTLQEEFPGYRDYAFRVRYRLIPFVF